jgi:hypothetical protein
MPSQLFPDRSKLSTPNSSPKEKPIDFSFPPNFPLLDLALEVLASNQVWDVIIILLLVLTLLALLHGLVGFGELAEGGKRVWAELVKDTWDELGELLVLTVTVDGEGVGWDGSVDYCPC